MKTNRSSRLTAAIQLHEFTLARTASVNILSVWLTHTPVCSSLTVAVASIPCCACWALQAQSSNFIKSILANTIVVNQDLIAFALVHWNLRVAVLSVPSNVFWTTDTQITCQMQSSIAYTQSSIPFRVWWALWDRISDLKTDSISFDESSVTLTSGTVPV